MLFNASIVLSTMENTLQLPIGTIRRYIKIPVLSNLFSWLVQQRNNSMNALGTDEYRFSLKRFSDGCHTLFMSRGLLQCVFAGFRRGLELHSSCRAGRTFEKARSKIIGGRFLPLCIFFFAQFSFRLSFPKNFWTLCYKNVSSFPPQILHSVG